MKLFNSYTLPFSTLYNERTFYEQFLKDLDNCENEVVIESPYITASRMETFYPVFQRLLNRKKKVSIVTRDPAYHLEETPFKFGHLETPKRLIIQHLIF